MMASQHISFSLDESSLSVEWKDRITAKLNSIPDVFACGDLDFGHTEAVKHRIRLSDPTPFKQRARPIHPADYDTVRLHFKELQDANIIRESALLRHLWLWSKRKVVPSDFELSNYKRCLCFVEVEEEDKHKTAFITPWEFNKMPQGVTNASTFQRVMERCMGSMNLKE
ncbi:hypothetical protein NFI96_028432, partial [Prochilodus magdalenae]